jgi:hypothetical protein
LEEKKVPSMVVENKNKATVSYFCDRWSKEEVNTLTTFMKKNVKVGMGIWLLPSMKLGE